MIRLKKLLRVFSLGFIIYIMFVLVIPKLIVDVFFRINGSFAEYAYNILGGYKIFVHIFLIIWLLDCVYCLFETNEEDSNSKKSEEDIQKDKH